MKHIRLFGLLVFLSFWLAACGSPSANPSANPTRFEPYPEEATLLGLTNDFRAQAQTCGNQPFAAVPALTWVEAIGDTAWFHSTDMGAADSENHVGTSTIDRLKARGFDPGVVAEHHKKTALPGNPADAFNAWKADPASCANLMNSKFTVMGAGLWGQYEGGNNAYWTQILSAPKGAAAAEPSLTISPTTATATVGGAAIPFTATLSNATSTISFSLTGPGTFSSAGASATYTPPATGGAGTATITATAGALTASATITLNAAAPPASLTVSPTTATVNVGGAGIPFTATLTNSTDAINWSMTGPGSFTVAGSTATFTPLATGGDGTATLTATAGALTASAVITITAPPPPAININEFLTLINQFRSQPQTCLKGTAVENMPAVPAVTFDAPLNKAAQLHSEDMATNNYFDHTGLNGSTFGSRIAAQGYTGTAQGENIAAGQSTTQGAFDTWRNSNSGHCQNMMGANLNEIGLGHAFNTTSTWKHYWTLVFGKK